MRNCNSPKSGPVVSKLFSDWSTRLFIVWWETIGISRFRVAGEDSVLWLQY